MLTKLDGHPDKVARLEIALIEAKKTPKADTNAFMEAVEKRIKDAEKLIKDTKK